MKRYWVPLLLLLFFLAVPVRTLLPDSGPGEHKTQASPMKIKAPEFPEGMEWLNTGGRPVRLAELRGKMVLLDFWTYCCINCMHVMPELKKLEARHPNNLVVIGVHSAKFTNERVTGNIRQAMLRYGLEHPVVNDSEFRIWNAYGVRAWPTLVLIDPEGNFVSVYSGEGNFEDIDRQIEQYVKWYRQKDMLNETPSVDIFDRLETEPTPLSFPGKILADPDNDRLFIADSGHNRIVITRRDGQVLDVAGSGEEGVEDGGFEEAGFSHPQGMALDGDVLYVADTENHLIRRLDLTSRTVTTIAGSGRQADFLSVGGLGTKAALSSPWDLELVGGNKLYIAMAGLHQIWVMDLGNNLVQPYAGSRREGIRDGVLDKSEMAQPSGIASDGKKLYVADSETSSVREIDTESGRVRTVIGRGLFIFGDRDGNSNEARLQHPLGVAYRDGLVYVADTYNHKIKVIDPAEGTSNTFLGSGRPGHEDDGGIEFYEPGGLDFAGGKLYIADTNNHAIRVADLSGNVTTLSIVGIKP
ncbi:MAG: thioredoxin-like domain-containing protein [Candidatus Brocadiales bacterium]|nr:thioredoxin-like domain-containing protein [Candidatus Bathyanammoxibius amoris]